jgi:hypothetical protein
MSRYKISGKRLHSILSESEESTTPKTKFRKNPEQKNKKLEISQSNRDGKNVIILKGDDQEYSLNIDNVKSTLVELRKYSSRTTSALEGELNDKFKFMVGIISMTYDSGIYSSIYELIQDIFGVGCSTVPGTIGAYFSGCLIQTNSREPQNCSAVCAGSLPPPPNTQGWNFCSERVFLYDGYGRFKTLNKNNKSNKAYIHLDGGLKFVGFSKKEIRYLKYQGILHVKLISYTDHGKSYEEVTTKFVLLNELPKTKEEYEKENSNGWQWLVAIIILLILIAGGVFYYNRYNNIEPKKYLMN